MKKLLSVSILSFLFLELSSLTSYFIPNNIWSKAWIPLVIGFFLMLISGVCSLIGSYSKNKQFSFVPLLSNGLGLGLCIEAWYVFRGYNNSLLIMTLVSLIATAVLWVFYLFLLIPFFNNHYKFYVLFFIILGLICYIIIIISTKTTFVSTIGYYLIISTGFILALSTQTDDKLVIIKRMANSTYSVLIVGIIILVIMLDGDLDFDIGSGIDLSLDSPRKIKQNNSQL